MIWAAIHETLQVQDDSIDCLRGGRGAETGSAVSYCLGRCALFVTAPTLRPGLRNRLFCAGIQIPFFDQVEADPVQATLAAAVAAGRQAGISGVFKFGGGSIDG